MNKVLKLLTAVALTGGLAYVLVLRSPEIRQNVAVRDSIAYWAAGRLAIHHQNPYDHATVFQLEQGQGYKDSRPLILRTPPWSLFAVAPLGLFQPFGAWVTWIGLSLASLFIGMRLCTRMYAEGTPPNLFSVVGYTFAPVPACLVSGQMGLVLMLGTVLFLWWEPKRPVLAGVALVLPFAKPHLLSLFWFIFILWIVLRRKRDIALGFLGGLTSAIAIALALDPHVFQHYFEMLHTASIGNEFIPALSGVLRLLFFRRMFWMQFMPLAAGLIWALRFFARNASSWDWKQHGPALLVVSVLTTPYEWLSDETILLPAILQAAAFAYAARAGMKARTKIAVGVFGLLNILLLLILKSKVPFSTGIYFWSSLVWFLLYFFARRWYARASGSPAEIEVAALNSKSGP